MEVNKIPCLQERQSYNRFYLFILCLFSFSCGDLGKEEIPPPSRPIQTQFKVEDFSSAQECQSCHPTHYDEWSSSMHAYSAKDPVWLSLQRHAHQVHDAKGIDLGNFCVQCHSPVAALTDAITDHNAFSLSDYMLSHHKFKKE